MGRGDPDPLPPIEIVGAPPAAASLQRVTTGPGGPRRPGRWVLAGAIGVVLLAVGLALDGGGDTPDGDASEEVRDNSAKLPLKGTTTTRPGATTTRRTTTTTTRPIGPVLGPAVGAGLLSYGPTEWQLVDLDTGAVTEPDLPVDDPYGVVPVAGGVVTIDFGAGRGAAFQPIRPEGTGDPVRLGAADQVLPAGRPDRVWLVDGGEWTTAGGGIRDGTAAVHLVDLHGAVLRSFDVPARYVSRGLAAGIVLERAGRIYLADERGVRPVAVGSVVGVSGDALVVLSCDDHAECAIEWHPVDGRPPRTLFPAPDPEGQGFSGATGPDGRFALQTSTGEGDDQVWHFLAADGSSLGSLLTAPGVYLNAIPSWLPGDLGLLSAGPGGPVWLRAHDGEWTSQPLAASLAYLTGDVAYVIDW